MNVVVTGGATSLGLAICKAFSAKGARVFALDVNADAIAALPAGICGVVADMLDEGAVAQAFAEIRGGGDVIDVLVNNVGLGGPRAPVESVPAGEWWRTLSGSVGSAFLCIQHVVPDMKARKGGCIINISSSSAKTGLPNRTAYVVAKAALEALCANCARELGPFGIRVNTIRPGALDNARMRAIIDDRARTKGISGAEAASQFLRYFSMRSLIGLEEVADMAVFLASPQAKHVTGQCIGVDGNAEWEE